MKTKIINSLRHKPLDTIRLIEECMIMRGSTKEYVLENVNRMINDITNYVDPIMVLDTTEYRDKILDNILVNKVERKFLQENIFLEEGREATLSDTRFAFLDIMESDRETVDDKIPVFFIFNGGSNALSSLIKAFTKGDLSHASISTEGINEIVSFGTSYKNNGLMVEGFYEFLHVRKPSVISIHALRLSPEDYEMVRDMIEFYKRNINAFKYSFKKLFLFPFVKSNVDKEFSSALICSEFVNYILTNTAYNKERLNNKEIFISPQRLRDILVNSKYTDIIFEGSPINFSGNLIDNYRNIYSSKAVNLKKDIDDRIKRKYDSIELDQKARLEKRLSNRLELNLVK